MQVSVHGLSLRKSPGIDGKMIRKMARGESGRVIGGPERVGGFIWWALKLKNGDTGWVTEKKVLASTESTGESVRMLRILSRNDSPPEPKPVTAEKKTDLKAFSPFFTADATENGELIQDLWPIYRHTFQIIDRIDYTIKLLEHAVELHTRTIHLKGRVYP